MSASLTARIPQHALPHTCRIQLNSRQPQHWIEKRSIVCPCLLALPPEQNVNLILKSYTFFQHLCTALCRLCHALTSSAKLTWVPPLCMHIPILTLPPRLAFRPSARTRHIPSALHTKKRKSTHIANSCKPTHLANPCLDFRPVHKHAVAPFPSTLKRPQAPTQPTFPTAPTLPPPALLSGLCTNMR
jgi:hypothetical protein